MIDTRDHGRLAVRLACVGALAILITPPLLNALTEFCYFAHPSHAHEPGSPFESVFASWLATMSEPWVLVLAGSLAVLAVLHELAVAWFPLFSRRFVYALVAILAFAGLVGYNVTFHSLLDHLSSNISIGKIMLAWFWFTFSAIPVAVYCYGFRSTMAISESRPVKSVFWLGGMVFALPLIHIAAHFIGEGDGLGQVLVALYATIGLVPFLAGGLVDLFDPWPAWQQSEDEIPPAGRDRPFVARSGWSIAVWKRKTAKEQLEAAALKSGRIDGSSSPLHPPSPRRSAVQRVRNSSISAQ